MISIISLLFVYGNEYLCFLLDCFLFGTKGEVPSCSSYSSSRECEGKLQMFGVTVYICLDFSNPFQPFQLFQCAPHMPLKLFQAHKLPWPLRQACAVPSCISGAYFQWNDLVDDPRFLKENHSPKHGLNLWDTTVLRYFRYLHQWVGQPINQRNHRRITAPGSRSVSAQAWVAGINFARDIPSLPSSSKHCVWYCFDMMAHFFFAV